MKITDRLKALKAAALKKQQELQETQSDEAFGRELMRLQHIKELEKQIKAKQRELHDAQMSPFMGKKIKPDGYYKYWIE